jgi:2',3'-cyclic-nucleotide 2'-phosphodiesterase (5'-nucleotidase family)
MTRLLSRTLLALVLGLGCGITASTAGPQDSVLQPNKLVVLSTTDVKGKLVPCGCHVPKGGLARRATFIDSMRTSFGQVLLVDNGGLFPEDDAHRDAVPFLLDEMKSLGTDAVNVGERDLRFGRSFLEQSVRRVGIPFVSANLLDKGSNKPVFPPSLIKQVGTVKVGILGLISDKADLGPSKDSLLIDVPLTAARNAVADLKRQGAQVIVLLSQLGKIEGEELVSNVDGIDAIIMGRSMTLIQRGRMVKNTIACYGGDQGHYVCRTQLTLDEHKHMTSAESEAVILGPEVRDKADIASRAKALEDATNQKIEKAQKQAEVKS